MTNDHDRPTTAPCDEGYERWPIQRITVTVAVPAGGGVEIIAAEAFLEVVRHLTNQGIEVAWRSIDIAGPSHNPC